MECVIALAIVSLISAILTPLISSAIHSFKFAESFRATAAEASSANALSNKDMKDVKVYVTGSLYDGRDDSLVVKGDSTFTLKESEAVEYEKIGLVTRDYFNENKKILYVKEGNKYVPASSYKEGTEYYLLGFYVNYYDLKDSDHWGN